MSVNLRTPEQIAKMRIAGKLAAEVLELIGEYVIPGVSTEELDRICHDHIVHNQKAIPACLGYRGFPKSICTSVNQVVCHGIPSDKKILKRAISSILMLPSSRMVGTATPAKCISLATPPSTLKG